MDILETEEKEMDGWKLLTDPEMCFHRFSQVGDIFVLKTSETYTERPNISQECFVQIRNDLLFCVCVKKKQQLTSRRAKI